MGDMEGFIAKGSILCKIDEISTGPDRKQKIADFLAALESSDPDYVGILVTHAKLDKFEEAHLRQDWFPSDPKGGNSWWPAQQPIAPLIGDSLIFALKKALELDLPVASYWLCPEGGDFKASVTWNDHQVTRMILTPPMPPGVAHEPHEPVVGNEIWIIEKNTAGQPERKRVEFGPSAYT